MNLINVVILLCFLVLMFSAQNYYLYKKKKAHINLINRLIAAAQRQHKQFVIIPKTGRKSIDKDLMNLYDIYGYKVSHEKNNILLSWSGE